MQTVLLYGLTAVLLCISFQKDRKKSKKALKKAWKSFENILPQLLGVILLVGIMMSFLDPDTISNLIGDSSGWVGIVMAGVIGSITLIPAFVAFPTAALLLENGAGLMQIAAFVSTLMMVGVMTFPLEVSFFGRKSTILRNLLAFVFSFIVAFVIGKVV